MYVTVGRSETPGPTGRVGTAGTANESAAIEGPAPQSGRQEADIRGADALLCRILRHGPGALSDAELLALCLRAGRQGRDAVAFAGELLASLGDVRALLNASPHRLASIPGLGPARIGQLRAVLGLAERHAEGAIWKRPLLTDTAAVRFFLKQALSGSEREVFACLFLDSRHHLLAFERLFFGSVDRASVHPREVLKAALHHNAAAVVLAHNHPSGSAEPSPADIRLTEDLRSLLLQIDVRVLDHVVVGHGVTVSMAERGYL